MTLQQLECFHALAKTQNITKSAEEIHVSQPALSSMLKALESELGVSLFDRKGRTIVLNNAGTEFLKSVNSIFDILGRYQQKTIMASHEKRTEIVIGAYSTESGLVSLIDKYMEMHSNVSFRIVSHQYITRVNSEDMIDFLISSNPEEHKNRPQLKLWAAQSYAIIPKSYLTGKPTISLHDLVEIPFAFCSAPNVALPRSLNICKEAGFSPDICYFADERYSVLLMLLQGNCAAIVPKEDAEVISSLSDKLAALPIEETMHLPSFTDVIISWKDSSDLSPSALDFLNYIQAEYKFNQI
ncbi:MAG: LysR family transcriptional regulator [Youngiibacter sp.]|nr:LysR family transcriptional regulator [Youngiibacter sp.]